MTTIHYVEFMLPGVIMSESETRKVNERDPNKVGKHPENSFGFRFFDREEVVDMKETLKGKEKNYSGMYYFGRVITLETLEKKNNPDDKRLIQNLKWEKCDAVKTRLGNYQYFHKEKDKIVEYKP